MGPPSLAGLERTVMKLILKNLIILMIVSALLVSCSSGTPTNDVSSNCISDIYSWYVDSDNTAIITQVEGDISSEDVGNVLLVPAELDGHRVKSIGGFCMGNYPPKIVLPEGLETIAAYAFDECEIQEVYIPSTVSQIMDHAFSYCPELKSIIVSDENEYYQSLDGVLYSKDGLDLICCPEGVFSSSDCYSVKEGVETIHPGSFSGGQCWNISIMFPDSVKTIMNDAFYFYDSYIESISLPNNIYIEDEVFFYMNAKIMIRGFPVHIEKNTFQEGAIIYFNYPNSSDEPYIYCSRADLIDHLRQTYGVQLESS